MRSGRCSTSCRGEVLHLAWERVDRARGVILLDVTKSGKRREVPLNSRADAVLARRGSKSSGLVFGTRKWATSARLGSAQLTAPSW
jgi:integrase